MSENETESDGTGITDEQLPADLVPGHDNPLAEPLDAGDDAGDLLHEGKHAEQDEEQDDDGDDE